MMHEARADLTMLLGCLYLLIVGAGRWSLDALLSGSASACTDSVASSEANYARSGSSTVKS
jgi:hypothetical protein